MSQNLANADPDGGGTQDGGSPSFALTASTPV